MGKALFSAWLAAGLLCGDNALAQEKEATPPGGEEAPAAAPPAAAEPPAADAPKEGEVVTPSEQVGAGTDSKRDIFAVPRRSVLKRRRIELMPSYNVTLNSSMVRHHGFGGQLSFYLSESLFIALEGTYYLKQIQDRYYLIGVDQRVLPSVNRYIWSAFLDFGYVPISGKFTLFNSTIIHWETYVSGGVGVFQTEIIPKDPADNAFSNYRIAGLLPGIGARMFINRWFALDAYFKDYIFADLLEPNTRDPMHMDCQSSTMCVAKDKAQSQFTFNMVFGVGFSIWLPASYDYKTPR